MTRNAAVCVAHVQGEANMKNTNPIRHIAKNNGKVQIYLPAVV